MDAFRRWLFDTAGNQQPVGPALFLAAPGLYFAGSDISGDDLYETLACLAEHKLIERIDTDLAMVAITPRGVSRALSGGGEPTPSKQACRTASTSPAPAPRTAPAC
ncbi:hypothetical protein [Streptomyces sp. Wb2n-11]|uniref:hypothetical protein n=1 Tax=Streptomyces sp. Wb2n-11 TaxID=1030533 RepID=UPI000B8A1A30|nr:hypothetical protein [Streptomyces sp. Wb2n-11]